MSKGPGILSTIASELECPACEESYTTERLPKMLPCMDTVCLECVREYIDKSCLPGSFPCPVCESALDDPADGPANMRNNPTLMALMTALEDKEDDLNTLKCDEHKDTAAKYICLDCEAAICDGCYGSGSKSRSHYSHGVIEVEETSAEYRMLFREVMENVATAEKSIAKKRMEAEEEIQTRCKERRTDLLEKTDAARRDIDRQEKEQLAKIETARDEEMAHLHKQVKEVEADLVKKKQSAESILLFHDVLHSTQAVDLLPSMMENMKVSARELDIQRENLRGSGIFKMLSMSQSKGRGNLGQKGTNRMTLEEVRQRLENRESSVGGNAPQQKKQEEIEVGDNPVTGGSMYVSKLTKQFNVSTAK